MGGRFRFMFCFSVLLGILFFQGMAEGSGISRPFPRKLRVETASLLRRIADPPIAEDTVAESFEEGEDESGKGPAIGEAPESFLKMEHHIHHSDKSVAGGGVIIGGLVTAIFAAVYCYIRVTRKRDEDHNNDNNKLSVISQVRSGSVICTQTLCISGEDRDVVSDIPLAQGTVAIK